MEYDIYLKGKNGHTLKVKAFSEGGTRRIVEGGETNAWVSVTYNYSKYFYDTIDSELGIRWIYGKKGSECIQRLESSLKQLGMKRDNDYWKPTPGNAGVIVALLLDWCKQKPEGIFSGD
jgi:hypothetical protein